MVNIDFLLRESAGPFIIRAGNLDNAIRDFQSRDE